MKPFRPGVVTTRTLTPAAYLRLTPAQRRALSQVTLVPPRLGQPGMGGFQATLTTPRYRPR